MRVRRSQWLTWGRRSKCSQGDGSARRQPRDARRVREDAAGKAFHYSFSGCAGRAAAGRADRAAHGGVRWGGRARWRKRGCSRQAARAGRGRIAQGSTRRSRGGAHADSRERRSSPAPSHAFRDTGGSTRARAFAQAGFRGAATRRTEPVGRCAAKPWASIAPVVTGTRSADPPVPFPPARSARRENRAAPARAAPCSACCDRSRAAARRGAASRATAP
ncbi:hypothetical protein X977_3672 [Burkholderia pseudomallei MSHR7504]|nr:hypothetical protein X977_3672 [Burkholderia pseudomallei MSHR7504]